MNFKEALKHVQWVIDDSLNVRRVGEDIHAYPQYTSILLGWKIDSQPFFIAAHLGMLEHGLPFQLPKDEAVTLARNWLIEHNKAYFDQPDYVLSLIDIHDIYDLIKHEGGTIQTAIGWALKLARTCRSEAEETLQLFDKVWNYHGVEHISCSSNPTSNDGISYCNSGDGYTATLVYDWDTDEFWVGCWANWEEKAQTRRINDAWSNWIRDDFKAAIKQRLQLWDLDYKDDTEIRNLFTNACNAANSHPIGESSGVICEVEKIAATVTLEDLQKHKIVFEEMQDE